MNQEQIELLPNYDGLYFDATDGAVYIPPTLERGKYEFEVATWTSPVIGWLPAIFRPTLNPLNFAKRGSAQLILSWAKMSFDGPAFTLVHESAPLLFSRTLGYEILVEDVTSGAYERFNAGRLACNLMRHPLEVAKQMFLAEMRQAGIVANLKRSTGAIASR